jgi:hypothetical protein
MRPSAISLRQMVEDGRLVANSLGELALSTGSI